MKRRYKNTRPLSRRDFLKRAGGSIAAAAALKVPLHAKPVTAATIPPHTALDVPGVHAYPIEHSVAAGETLELCVSASVPHRLSICRLGLKVDDPAGDTVLHRYAEESPRPQPIHPGSYVHIEKRLVGTMRAISIECWVKPWDLTKLQGLVSQEDKDASDGFALGFGKDGYVGFYLGDGVSPDEALVHRSKTGVLAAKKWHHVVATWDGKTKRVFVDAKEVGAWEFAGPLLPGAHALRLGAMSQTGIAKHFLDGDLAMPAIYDRALSVGEISVAASLRDAHGAERRGCKGVLACWPLSEERGDRVSDSSGSGREGRIINHATWMVGGPGFDADVPRFGAYDPKKDATRGHGLRFASDDLYDCRWKVTHRWPVPADARSGIYVARIEFTYEGKPRLYHCTFIVRRAPRRKKAPILFVCATNTWRAYSGTPFAITPPNLAQVWGTGGIEKDARGLPAYCLYRGHAAGQGTYQMGLRMPWPAAGPYVLYGGQTQYSHLARADRWPQTWLESQGYDYDVISDVDLHRDPSVLRGYKTFMVVGHNEYWSREMYRGVESYLRGGGNLLVLSGNTMGWRVSFNDDCTVMESRKVDCPGNQMLATRRGEAWHSHDGERGGSQRESGMPGYRVIGLDIIGWNNQSNPKNYGPYVVEDASHFLFTTPEKSGLKNGDKFGWADGAMPMANGHEMDIRPSTFAALQEEPTPDGAVMPTDPAGIVRIANGILPWAEGGSPMDYYFRKIKPKTDQGGEMIYWVRPDGGRVFNAGAIGSGWVLHADERWATVVRNVLAHFGVERRGA
ncbi:MAG: LamG domain-containing protein [Chthoniobacteraceae bacterium]